MGGSQHGYDLGEIRWDDLGKKFMIKRNHRSLRPDYDLSSACRHYTIDERYENFRMPPNYYFNQRYEDETRLKLQKEKTDLT